MKLFNKNKKKNIKIVMALLVASFLFGCSKKNNPYKKKDNYIYFGYYPQTKVEDNKIIDKLNKKSGSLPDSSNLYNWKDCNYYIQSNVESFMYYIDIDLNSDGLNDYRGIFFTKYRPEYTENESSSSNSVQYDNGYFTNTVYWFKYEPIKWRIREEHDGKALLASDLIIDSSDFYPTSEEDKFEHNGGVGYANNYELSNVRKWLNNDFYNLAFNNQEKSIIVDELVDNSVDKTDRNAEKYTCNNTTDHIFLLSFYESMNETNDSRLAKGTDYAKAQGLLCDDNVYGYYRLRSPDSCGPTYLWTVMSDGTVRGGSALYTCFGTRPALWIKL